MSKKLYQPNKQKKQFNKEKMTIIDKLEVAGIVIASVAVITWSGFSIVDAFLPDPEPAVHEVMVDSVDSYINNVNAEGSKKEQAAKEEEERKAKEEAEKAEREAKAEADKKEKEEKKKAEKEAKEKAKKEEIQKKRRENAIQARKKLEEKLNAEEEAKAKVEAEKNTVYTAKASLNIREEANGTAKSFGQYKPGDIVEVIEGETEEHPGWLKVKRESTEGYVSASFVEKK